jgi:hypothetical protein
MVTGGNGTATDVFGELFEIMTGVSLVKVPYRGDYMADLFSGQVQIVFGPMPSLLTQIQDGRVRANMRSPIALVDRGTPGILHREGRQRPAACLPLFRGRAAATNVDEAAIARRGIPYRGEHRQAAERAAADLEGHSAAAKYGQPGRLIRKKGAAGSCSSENRPAANPCRRRPVN